MRLDQFVAKAMQLSRSQSRALIARGKIQVDGIPCKKADTQVSETAAVTAEGRSLRLEKFVYLMMNKPEGVVSATEDGRDTTVTDLVQSAYPRRTLFPAGRLDKTSTGFVLLTDDGGFAHDLLAPRHHVDKTYLVQLDTPLTEEMRRGFAQGVRLADGQLMLEAEAEPADPEDPCRVRVVLHQGVYHQIKRMFGVYGAGVNALHRTAIGAVQLDPSLKPGQWRPLTEEELKKLKRNEKR